ncbi:MAG: DUF4160 domain-containing protein [Candidatus Aminicenantes bacterium]|nr:DUF4160 domain-containing protein [Candidatus Aminicenantes bacterium]
MSPTIFREQGYRFFFFSREEERMHVHVDCADGEAKFWLEPEVTLVRAHGLSKKQQDAMLRIVKDRIDDITEAWKKHFSRRSN